MVAFFSHKSFTKLFAHALTICVLWTAIGCSTSVQLQKQGGFCEFDEQCEQPLVCNCVVKIAPDEEGIDFLIKAGKCNPKGTTCSSIDAGIVRDSAKDSKNDVLSDGVTDTASETSTDSSQPMDSSTDVSTADSPADVVSDTIDSAVDVPSIPSDSGKD